jgi:hypothetical protein
MPDTRGGRGREKEGEGKKRRKLKGFFSKNKLR